MSRTESLFACVILAAAGLAQQQRAPQMTLDSVVTAPATFLEFLPVDQWIPGTRQVSRLRPREPSVVTVYAPGSDAETVAFRADAFHRASAQANAGPMPPFTWATHDTIRVQRQGGVHRWKVGAEQTELVLPLPKDADPMAIAADDSRVAFVTDHQLHVQIGKTAAKAITADGSPDIVYGGPAHRSEFGIHDGLWWSPDARFLAFFREDMRPITPYPYVDHTVLPPKAVHGRYPMAGGANSHVQVGVYDTQTGELHYLEHGAQQDKYWTNVTFDPSSRKVYVALVNRAQDAMELVRFDAESGALDASLFQEKDAEWIEPEHGPLFHGDRSDRFLWFSPRDGYRHLYLYDADGKLVRQVTKGSFDIAGFLGFAPGGEKLYAMASGDNPLEMHLFEADLATGAMRRITADRGWHTCRLSGDGAFVHDSFSNLENPGQSQLLDLSTGKVSHVTKIGHRLPARGRQEFFTTKAADGRDLHGTIIVPPALDPAGDRKYPVLLYVYGGPHSQLVKDTWLGGAGLWLHFMATQGFVVCTLDNRGTDNRGIEFSQSVFRRLGTIEVEDQLLALEHLFTRPYVDRTRVGVHGWSYGGYMTLRLMLRAPKVFACGAAGAPVTDWAQYETGYTERYMDTPQENPDGYQSASVLPLARSLAGRLLVLHGTDDKTVLWSHSLAFVDRCIEEGVLLDYMPYPMQQHGIAGKDRLHLYRLLTRYFQDHLRPGQ